MDHSLRRLALLAALCPGLMPLAGCGNGYSPNTYASNAAQVEATVQRGTIIGVRQITISPDGTVGAVAGGAAGGVTGAQAAGAPVVSALGAIGGSLVGGISGAAAAQAVGKTKGWEYIVQEEPGDKLVSVTQTSKAALPIGLPVLVIAGSQQARIVPDYTVQTAAAKPTANPPPSVQGAGTAEVRIDPELPDATAADPLQGAPAPAPTAADPTTQPAPTAAPGAAASGAGAPGGTATPEAANNPVQSPEQIAAHDNSSTTAKP